MLAAVTLLWLILPGAFAASGKSTGVIRLDSGPIRGTVENGLRVFRGIPYAAPPVGALRWNAPQPVASWKLPQTQDRFGPSCLQPVKEAGGNFAEDCLYLNVWTPTNRPVDKLPVMVWIHGGGFLVGSAAWPEYHGAHLASKGVVLVSINYRLNAFGYFTHPALSESSPQRVSGNYGLLDQIAALAWVKRNIAAFGGDPDNVTLFGQSAGSRSTSLLVISPLAEGLFVRAIAQSGGPILGSEYLAPAFNGDMANTSRMGQELSGRLGCDKTDDELACLRQIPAEKILKAADISTDIFRESLFFAPVFDGYALPKNPATAYTDKTRPSIPMIVGSTLNEGTIYLGSAQNLAIDKYKSFLQARFADKADNAFATFPATSNADVARAVDFFVTVAVNAQPARFMAAAIAGNGGKAYLYQFTRKPDTAWGRAMGVHHGADLAYVFGNMKPSDGYVAADKTLSEQMMGYWINFARSGNPNGPGLPLWPQYDASTDRNMEFGNVLRVNTGLYKTECDTIEKMSRFQP